MKTPEKKFHALHDNQKQPRIPTTSSSISSKSNTFTNQRIKAQKGMIFMDKQKFMKNKPMIQTERKPFHKLTRIQVPKKPEIST